MSMVNRMMPMMSSKLTSLDGFLMGGTSGATSISEVVIGKSFNLVTLASALGRLSIAYELYLVCVKTKDCG